MVLYFLISQKGKKQLLYQNYVFNERQRGENVIHWRYASYYKTNCKIKVDTTSDKKSGEVIREDNEKHNHMIEKSEIEALKVKNKIKKQAVKSSETSMNIVTKQTSQLSKTTSAMLPKNKSLCRSAQRARFKEFGSHSLPATVSELIVPDVYTKTLRGEEFLYRDFCEGENSWMLIPFCPMHLALSSKTSFARKVSKRRRIFI